MVIDVAGDVVWANEERQRVQFTTVTTQREQSIRQFMEDVEKTECESQTQPRCLETAPVSRFLRRLVFTFRL